MKKFSGNLIWHAAGVIAAIPVFFWLFMLPLATRFGTGFAFFSSLGQLTGLVGMTWFSLNMILSARLRFFDRVFKGLNRVYVAHHLIGGVAFILLLFHPVFLAARLAIASVRSAALFLIPGSNLPVDLGIYGLGVMMILLVLTFFAVLRYHIWKFSHKFLGLAFFLGGLHSLFIASDISRNAGLRAYMLTLAVLGLAAYLYRTISGGRMAKKYYYKVESVKKLHETIVEIKMVPEAEPVRFNAGQFAFISFADAGGWGEEHPFSFSSSPSERAIILGIRTGGDFVKNAGNIPIASRARLEGPYGNFSYESAEGKKQVWIAGGIGVTPFLSMARSLAEKSDFGGYQIDFFYCVKTDDEFIALEEIKNIAAGFPGNFHLQLYCSVVRGYINAEEISRIANGLAGKEIFLCGPVPMMAGLKKQFNKLGVHGRNIHSEEFSF